MTKVIEVLVLIAAALLEVGGDALIRGGLRGGRSALVVLGFAVLGSYGVVVNLLQLDFSRLLGAYVGFFAIAAALFGRHFYGERMSRTTWLGLAVVLVGSLIVQLGSTAAESKL